MNLYLRMLWLFLTYRFKPAMQLTDVLERQTRVLPSDLDLNGHMNNGRYLTLVDLAILETFLRSGVLIKALRNGWRPMLGGSIISYRRGLKPFARYTLRFELQSWDERWNYFRFEFLGEGRTLAAGYVKGAMVSRNGWVANTQADQLFGVARQPSIHHDAVRQWIDSERALASELSR